jgi:hypothetical protein
VDALLAQAGVRSARASAHTGSILVRFERPASASVLARVIAQRVFRGTAVTGGRAFAVVTMFFRANYIINGEDPPAAGSAEG